MGLSVSAATMWGWRFEAESIESAVRVRGCAHDEAPGNFCATCGASMWTDEVISLGKWASEFVLPAGLDCWVADDSQNRGVYIGAFWTVDEGNEAVEVEIDDAQKKQIKTVVWDAVSARIPKGLEGKFGLWTMLMMSY